MPLFENILDVGAIGANVYKVTKNPADSAAASGYAQWIKSITGRLPYAEIDQYGRARVFLDPEQARIMRQWLEQSAIKSVRSKPVSGTLYIDFRPVAEPIVLQYGLIAAAIFTGLGFFLGRTF